MDFYDYYGNESEFITFGTRALDPRMSFDIDEDRRQSILELLGKAIEAIDRCQANLSAGIDRAVRATKEDANMPFASGGELLEGKSSEEVIMDEEVTKINEQEMFDEMTEAEVVNEEQKPDKEPELKHESDYELMEELGSALGDGDAQIQPIPLEDATEMNDLATEHQPYQNVVTDRDENKAFWMFDPGIKVSAFMELESKAEESGYEDAKLSTVEIVDNGCSKFENEGTHSVELLEFKDLEIDGARLFSLDLLKQGWNEGSSRHGFDGRDRNSDRGQGYRPLRSSEKKWVLCPKHARLGEDNKIKSLEQIYFHLLPIMEFMPVQNRSPHLRTIKTGMETHGYVIDFLIKEAENVIFVDIDERDVLKHFEWPDRKEDASIEAAYGYSNLKKLESEVSLFCDDQIPPCVPVLKRMQFLLKKLEHGVYNFSRRKSVANKYKLYHIPMDWMLDTDRESQIKLATVNLAMNYINRISTQLCIHSICKMATNLVDTLDPTLLYPGTLYRKIESTTTEVDPRLLKATKTTMCYSDSELWFAAQTLMSVMKHNHSQVAASEVGGITQGIGAYRVQVPIVGKPQTYLFLDILGHEEFGARRARGAIVTDIAIIVVAADDGIRSQRSEATAHAKEAGIPIPVVIDKDGTNPDQGMQDLSSAGVIPEEWGGDTPMVKVCFLKGKNIDDLLEIVMLVSELQKLKASPNKNAKGTIIEADCDNSKGTAATFIMQNRTLKRGDVVCGEAYTLGFGDPIALSAKIGLGLADLCEAWRPSLEDYVLQNIEVIDEEIGDVKTLGDIMLHVEKEILNLQTFTYKWMDWLKWASSLPFTAIESSIESTKDFSYQSTNMRRQHSEMHVANKVAAIELVISSVFRAVILLCTDGYMESDAVAFFPPDEGGNQLHLRGFSSHLRPLLADTTSWETIEDDICVLKLLLY